MINFEEFQKIELKVVKVLEASRIDGSEKLLKLIVDLGEDPSISHSTQRVSDSKSSGQVRRQIIAGIGKAYEPESLIGKEIVIVANLEPRQLMGLESQGMVLAASNENGPVILMPEKEVPPGSQVK